MGNAHVGTVADVVVDEVVDVVGGASVVDGVDSVVVVESVEGVGAPVVGVVPTTTAGAAVVVGLDFLPGCAVVEVVLLLELVVVVGLVDVVVVDAVEDVVLGGGMATVVGGSWTAAA